MSARIQEPENKVRAGRPGPSRLLAKLGFDIHDNLMRYLLIVSAAIALFLSAVVFAAPSQAGLPQPEAGSSPGVVVLETEGDAGGSVRIAEELASATNDGASRRLLPVIGVGSLQNIMDFKLLRGIDLAILQTDVLDYVKQRKLVPGIESWLTYISKLYNEEFHLVARADIKTISDLANQNVSVDVSGAGTAITAARLFDILKMPVHTVNLDPEQALEKLRNREIAAIALVAGKPAPLFCDLIGENGLHFLSLPPDLAVNAGYAPARLTAADYPALIPFNQPVDTVSVGTVLAVNNLQPGSEHYRSVANFAETFFNQFQSLLQPGRHPKWREVDLTGDLTGWRRFPPVAQWLPRTDQMTSAPNLQELKAQFSQFIDERRQAGGDRPLTEREKQQLFDQFKGWAAARPELWRNRNDLVR